MRKGRSRTTIKNHAADADGQQEAIDANDNGGHMKYISTDLDPQRWERELQNHGLRLRRWRVEVIERKPPPFC